MRINIELLSKEIVTLSVESEKTILDLKRELAKHLKTPVEQANNIHLYFSGKMLNNVNTLKESNVITDSILVEIQEARLQKIDVPMVVEIQEEEKQQAARFEKIDTHMAREIKMSEMVAASLRPSGHKIVGTSLGLF